MGRSENRKRPGASRASRHRALRRGMISFETSTIAANRYSRPTTSVVKQMLKIFVSHAVVDAELAGNLADFLQLGAGVSHSEIFLSSRKGNIPNGQYFVAHILKELNAADLVIAMVSKSYLESHFCLEELGAALSRKTENKATFYSLLVPPVTFSDLDGVLYGMQAGSILDRAVLNELREVITSAGSKAPSLADWDQKRDSFLRLALEAVGGLEADELMCHIILKDVRIDRDNRPAIHFKSKLRITFENDTGKELVLHSSVWDKSRNGVPCIGPSPYLLWQVARGQGWSDESASPEISVGDLFRTWIALNESVTDGEILRRCALRQLGTLEAHVSIGEYRVLFTKQL